MPFDFNNAITLLLVYDIPTSVAFYRDLPRNTYYGMRQVHLLDPDGYSLVFQRPVAGN
jgi:hypothetical protein